MKLSLQDKQQILSFAKGKAGTGKSFFIRVLINLIRLKNISYVVCASTGIAASLIDGFTVHSTFGIYTKKFQNEETVLCSSDISKPNGYSVSFASVIIIDEVTMISAEVMNALNRGLKKIMAQKSDANFDKPFGGKSVWLFGDLAQVPAVTRAPDDYNESIGQFHQSGVFSSFIKLELRTSMRQLLEEKVFLFLLDSIRCHKNNQQINDDVLEVLQQRFIPGRIDEIIDKRKNEK